METTFRILNKKLSLLACACNSKTWQRKEKQEFKGSLSFIASLMQAWAAFNPVSKEKEKNYKSILTIACSK